jgi:hypothetical protein
VDAVTIAWACLALLLIALCLRRTVKAPRLNGHDMRQLRRFSEDVRRKDFFPFD